MKMNKKTKTHAVVPDRRGPSGRPREKQPDDLSKAAKVFEFKVNTKLNEKHKLYLEKHFSIKFVSSKNSVLKPHPLWKCVRDYSEFRLLQGIKKMALVVDCDPNRHRLSNVHAVCSENAFRQSSSCHHKTIDCDCHDYGLVLFTAEAPDPEVIAKQISSGREVYMSMPDIFPRSQKNQLFNGEAKISHHPDFVTIDCAGNTNESYYKCTWLWKQKYISTAYGYLTWESIFAVSDWQILKFQLTTHCPEVSRTCKGAFVDMKDITDLSTESLRIPYDIFHFAKTIRNLKDRDLNNFKIFKARLQTETRRNYSPEVVEEVTRAAPILFFGGIDEETRLINDLHRPRSWKEWFFENIFGMSHLEYRLMQHSYSARLQRVLTWKELLLKFAFKVGFYGTLSTTTTTLYCLYRALFYPGFRSWLGRSVKALSGLGLATLLLWVGLKKTTEKRKFKIVELPGINYYPLKVNVEPEAIEYSKNPLKPLDKPIKYLPGVECRDITYPQKEGSKVREPLWSKFELWGQFELRMTLVGPAFNLAPFVFALSSIKNQAAALRARVTRKMVDTPDDTIKAFWTALDPTLLDEISSLECNAWPSRPKKILGDYSSGKLPDMTAYWTDKPYNLEFLDNYSCRSDYEHYVYWLHQAKYSEKRKVALSRTRHSFSDPRALKEVHFKGKNFVKKELTDKPPDPNIPIPSDPRVITAMTDEVLVHMAPLHFVMTKALCSAFNVLSPWFYPSGCDNEAVSYWFNQLPEKGWFYTMDCSRFSASVGYWAMNFVARDDERLFKLWESASGKNHWIRDTYELRTISKGSFRSGVSFSTPFTAADGDSQTSARNTKISFALVHKLLETLGVSIKEVRVIANGDDCILWSPVRIDCNRAIDLYSQAGFKLKIAESQSLDDTEFCSQIFWHLEDGTRLLGPKLGKFMLHFPYSLTSMKDDPTVHESYRVEKARALLPSVAHIPILKDFITLQMQGSVLVPGIYNRSDDARRVREGYKLVASEKHVGDRLKNLTLIQSRYGLTPDHVEYLEEQCRKFPIRDYESKFLCGGELLEALRSRDFG
jgi:hypothetical protein